MSFLIGSAAADHRPREQIDKTTISDCRDRAAGPKTRLNSRISSIIRIPTSQKLKRLQSAFNLIYRIQLKIMTKAGFILYPKKGSSAMAPRWLVILPLAITSASLAAPPPDMRPNPVMEAWFKALQQPSTHKPCCSISDCRFTDYRQRNGHFEVTIDGWPYIVPDTAVLHDVTSPTAQAVVCYAYTGFGSPVPAGKVRAKPQDTVAILCFIPVGMQS